MFEDEKFNFEEGDTVRVEGVIKYLDPAEGGWASVKLHGQYDTVILKTKTLIFVHRHFDIGDRVYNSSEDTTGVVLAVADGWAWVLEDSGRRMSVRLTGLEKQNPLPMLEAAE